MREIQRCFVIAPINELHKPITTWLVDDVLTPILKPKGFEIHTPDVPEIGNIMDYVIESCDRAQLVVADTTGNNPNVLYEMAVLDAMGRACIPVKVVGSESQQDDKMPFDRAAYRYFDIDRNKTQEAVETLGRVIEKALSDQARGDPFSNPLTDFFGVPLSSFSSGYGLARGYYYNLVKPAVDAIVNGKILEGPSTLSDLPEKKLYCVIPEILDNAMRSAIRDLEREGHIQSVVLEAPGRQININAWPENGPISGLLDIPTTMVALQDTVQGRLGKSGRANLDRSSPDYLDLQADEISRFQRYLQGFIAGDPDTLGRDVRARVKVIRWSETPLALMS